MEIKLYDDMELTARAKNTGRTESTANLSVRFLGDPIISHGEELAPGESVTWNASLYERRYPEHDIQTVRVGSTIGGLTHNYTAPVTAADTNDTLMPQIHDVEVIRDGDDTRLAITVRNPSPHSVRDNVLVHTERTKVAWSFFRAEANDTSTPEPAMTTREIELNESADEPVNGTVRYFAGQYDRMNDSLDQVYFEEGAPGGEIAVEKEEYRPIPNAEINPHYEPTGLAGVQEDVREGMRSTMVDPPLLLRIAAYLAVIVGVLAMLRRHDHV